MHSNGNENIVPPGSGAEHETEWLHKLKAGDRQAFAQLVQRFRHPVINICYRFLMQQEDAEDVAQEVFIEVFQSVRQFRGEAGLGTWIYRIAVTKSLDELKRRKRKKRISSVGKVLHIDQFLDWLTGNQRPDKDLEDKDNYRQLLLLFDRLPENQRIALTLSKMEGYSHPDIAEIMDTTVSAVDSLLYRAKQQIKEMQREQRQ